MQGYGTLAVESERQLKEYNAVPSHVFVQAGVGSMAGAMNGYFALEYGDKRPVFTVMEPETAGCIFKSATEKSYQTIGGDLSTLMAGLSCGEPNTISWEILKNHTDFFASIPDWVAARGVRILSSPLPGDERVISGESGAVGTGFLSILMGCEDYAKIRKDMGLDENSVVLLISTEGDTDPELYRDIVWDGKYASHS
jgi:diaminopropionate ammonia-lyase